MGGSNSQSKTFNSCKSLPKFSYFIRAERKILIFENSQANVDALPEGIPCYPNSSICESEGIIFVAGGSDQSNSIKSCFFSIDSNTPRVRLLEPLPIPSKLGYLKFHKSSIYHVGGVSLDPLSRKKTQTPIMRYNILKESWEIFNHSNLLLGKKRTNSFKDLRKPGCALIKNKLLIFAGYFKRGSKREPNTQVISFNLSSDNLDYSFEKIAFPVALYSPVVSDYKRRAVIAGGKLLNSSQSQDVVEYKKSAFKPIAGKKLLVPENHPPIYQELYIIIFAYPKVHIREKKTKDWLQFELPSNTSIPLPTPSGGTCPQPTQTTQPTQSLQASDHSKSLPHLVRKPYTFSPNTSNNFASSSDSLNPLMTFGSESARSFGLGTNPEDLDVDFDFIMQTESDEKVSIFHKQAIKLFAFASERLESKKLSAIEINQISTQLGFKGFVSISEVSTILTEILQKKAYQVAGLLKFYQIVHKVLDRPRVRSGVILAMLRMNEIYRTNECINATVSIFVMTRIVKITVVGV